MAVDIEKSEYGVLFWNDGSMSFVIDAKDVPAFKRIIQRGINTMQDAPELLMKFADALAEMK